MPYAGCSLGREALVAVVVPGDYDLGAGVVQCLPQRLSAEIAAVGHSRAEQRLVPHRERALRRVRGEIGAEPLLLGRPGGHRLVVVEHDDVPRA